MAYVKIESELGGYLEPFNINMRIKLIFLIFLSVSTLPACAHFSPKGVMAVNEDDLWRIEPEHQNEKFVLSGRIINKERLKVGGSLLILPFKPGEKVEVGARFDQTSLMVLRGIIDVFEKKKDEAIDDCACANKDKMPEVYNDIFDLVISDSDVGADFILDGYIQEIKEGGRISQILMKDKKVLNVRGIITEKYTGKTVAVFNDRIERLGTDEDIKDMAREIGQNIGKFILHGVKD